MDRKIVRCPNCGAMMDPMDIILYARMVCRQCAGREVK